MADSAEKQLLEDIEKTATNRYECDENEFAEHREKLYTLLTTGKYDAAVKELKLIEEEMGWDLSEEIRFAERINDPDSLETVEEDQVDAPMPLREQQLLKKQVAEHENDELLARTEESVSNESLQNLSESLYREEEKLSFIISAQSEWEGRVSVELSGTKEKFELLSVYQNEEGEYFFKHFGQSTPNKGYNMIDQFSKSFYQYKFVADDKEYLALSTEKLETVRCQITGTKISLNDYKTVGEWSKVAVDKDIIFVHSVDPAVETLDDEELDNYRADVTHDDLATSLLGEWRQPEWFEKFFISDLMVNNENDYPSHVIWLAQPGTGKSKVVESLLKSMDERQKEPFTGSGSTVKGLVPSFKENPPDEGYLLKTQRVAGVDEKMDLLSNSIKQGNDAANDVFRPLLNLLTHDTRTFESGNGSIKGQMMSTMIATGNFNAYGISDMKQLAEKIDTAYLSRCIIYSQTKSHVEFINKRKAEVKQKMQEEGLNEDDLFPERDDEFLSVMDTMRESKMAQIDYMKVQKMHRDLMEIVPGYMTQVFRQRGAHHIENILLGLVKYRYLVEGRDSLEAESDDYDEVRHIFELIISGWDDVDTSKLSFDAKKEALTPAQRRVYNAIDDTPGILGSQLAEEVEVDSLSWALTELKRMDLVAVDDAETNTTYYPYWTDEYEELSKGDVIYDE